MSAESSEVRSEAIGTMRQWLNTKNTYSRRYYDFFTKWTILNLYYNTFPGQKETERILNFGDSHETIWDDDIENLARELASLECVGKKRRDAPPKDYVRDATLFLREIFRIDSGRICNKCQKRNGCNRHRTGEFNEKMKALIRIIYQIRCNLFHGDKLDAEDDFQKKRNDKLIEISNKILSRILESISSPNLF